jgi:hypothetical protein
VKLKQFDVGEDKEKGDNCKHGTQHKPLRPAEQKKREQAEQYCGDAGD